MTQNICENIINTMKKTLFVLLLVLSFVFPIKALAQDQLPEMKSFSVDKKTIIIHNPYFAYGEQVDLAGTITGDTYVAGGQVDISGKVNGDLLVTGGNITISGEVKEDLRIIGGQVNIKGRIGKNVSVAGGQIVIDEDAVINGSFVAAGGSIEINGPINDNVDIAAGNVILNNKVAKDFDVVAGEIKLGENANILGKFEYWSDVKPTIAQTAVVKGQVIEHPMPVKIETDRDWEKTREEFGKMSLGARILGTLSLLVIGMLIIKMSKKFMDGSSEAISKHFWKSMGIGFATVFLTPFAFIILLATVIGIPLAFIILPVYLIMLYLAKIFTIYALGKKILPNKSPYLTYLLGLVIYAIAIVPPVIGGIVNFFVLLVGTGAYLIAKKEALQSFNK